MSYDGAERMASWDANEYRYDDRNLRTRKVDDLGTITDFWYDDAGQLQAELGCDSTCVADEVRPLKGRTTGRTRAHRVRSAFPVPT